MRELRSAIAAIGGTMTAAEVEQAFHGRSLADIERGVAEHLGGASPDGWLERYLADRANASARSAGRRASPRAGEWRRWSRR